MTSSGVVQTYSNPFSIRLRAQIYALVGYFLLHRKDFIYVSLYSLT